MCNGESLFRLCFSFTLGQFLRVCHLLPSLHSISLRLSMHLYRSPVHPSIFATASSNGTVNLWNLASSLDQPISGSDGIPIGDDTPTTSPIDSSSVTASRRGLNRLRWSADGRRMAVASGDQLHVLGVGDDLWKCKGDEESRVMSNMISRGFIQDSTA